MMSIFIASGIIPLVLILSFLRWLSLEFIICFYFTALGNLGSVLSSQGRFEEAELALLGALKHRSNMADVHYNL